MMSPCTKYYAPPKKIICPQVQNIMSPYAKYFSPPYAKYYVSDYSNPKIRSLLKRYPYNTDNTDD